MFGMLKKCIIRSPQDLGEAIAQARRQRGLSQRQLAAEFGVTQAWISRVEQGYPRTWIGQVLRLAVHLGLELQLGSDSSEVKSAVEDKAIKYPDLDQLV
jgi:HTH-type transcriptional regulator/antitoxin HipB